MPIESYFNMVPSQHQPNNDDLAVKNSGDGSITFEKPLKPPPKWTRFLAALSNVPGSGLLSASIPEAARTVASYKTQNQRILRFKDFKADMQKTYGQEFHDLCAREMGMTDATPLTARTLRQATQTIETRMTLKNSKAVIEFLEKQHLDAMSPAGRAFIYGFVHESLVKEEGFARNALESESIKTTFKAAQNIYDSFLAQLDGKKETLDTILQEERQKKSTTPLTQRIASRVNEVVIEQGKIRKQLEEQSAAEKARKAAAEAEKTRLQQEIATKAQQRAAAAQARQTQAAQVAASRVQQAQQARTAALNAQKATCVATLKQCCDTDAGQVLQTQVENREGETVPRQALSADLRRSILDRATAEVTQEIERWGQDKLVAAQTPNPSHTVRPLLETRIKNILKERENTLVRIQASPKFTSAQKAQLLQLAQTHLLLVSDADCEALKRSEEKINDSLQKFSEALRGKNIITAARQLSDLGSRIQSKSKPLPNTGLGKNDTETRTHAFLSVALADRERAWSMVILDDISGNTGQALVRHLRGLPNKKESASGLFAFRQVVSGLLDRIQYDEKDATDIKERLFGAPSPDIETHAPSPATAAKVAESTPPAALPAANAPKPTTPPVHDQPEEGLFTSVFGSVASAINTGLSAIAEVFQESPITQAPAMPTVGISGTPTQPRKKAKAGEVHFAAQKAALQKAQSPLESQQITLSNGFKIDQRFYDELSTGLDLKLKMPDTHRSIAIDRSFWNKLAPEAKQVRIEHFCTDLIRLCGNEERARKVIAAASQRTAASFLDAVATMSAQTPLRLPDGQAAIPLNAPRPTVKVIISREPDEKIKMHFRGHHQGIYLATDPSRTTRYNLDRSRSELEYSFDVSLDNRGEIALARPAKYRANLRLGAVQPTQVADFKQYAGLQLPPMSGVLDELRAFAAKQNTTPYLEMLEAAWLLARQTDVKHEKSNDIEALRNAANRLPDSAEKEKENYLNLLDTALTSQSEDPYAPLVKALANKVKKTVFDPCMDALAAPLPAADRQ